MLQVIFTSWRFEATTLVCTEARYMYLHRMEASIYKPLQQDPSFHFPPTSNIFTNGKVTGWSTLSSVIFQIMRYFLRQRQRETLHNYHFCPDPSTHYSLHIARSAPHTPHLHFRPNTIHTIHTAPHQHPLSSTLHTPLDPKKPLSFTPPPKWCTPPSPSPPRKSSANP